jgi:hypothetical protein
MSEVSVRPLKCSDAALAVRSRHLAQRLDPSDWLPQRWQPLNSPVTLTTRASGQTHHESIEILLDASMDDEHSESPQFFHQVFYFLGSERAERSMPSRFRCKWRINQTSFSNVRTKQRSPASLRPRILGKLTMTLPSETWSSRSSSLSGSLRIHGSSNHRFRLGAATSQCWKAGRPLARWTNRAARGWTLCSIACQSRVAMASKKLRRSSMAFARLSKYESEFETTGGNDLSFWSDGAELTSVAVSGKQFPCPSLIDDGNSVAETNRFFTTEFDLYGFARRGRFDAHHSHQPTEMDDAIAGLDILWSNSFVDHCCIQYRQQSGKVIPSRPLTSFATRVSSAAAAGWSGGIAKGDSAMVIENRDAVVAGTKLRATYKKQQYVCSVEAGEDGKLAFVHDGKRFNSPSSAGTAIIGTACNGWRFWSIDGDVPIASTQPATKPKAKAPPASMPKMARRRRQQEKAKPSILHRHENQDDLSEGETRWLCSACLKNFTVFGNETPDTCPEGHRNDDSELTSPASTDEAAS